MISSPSYNAEGGRRSVHLRTMIQKLMVYTHIFVICGDNDVNSLTVEEICRNYQFVIRALHPRIIRSSGFLPRADFDEKLREKNNIFLAENLKDRYKSPKLVKKIDFDINGRNKCHLRYTQHGLQHLMAHCLSFLIDSFGDIAK